MAGYLAGRNQKRYSDGQRRGTDSFSALGEPYLTVGGGNVDANDVQTAVGTGSAFNATINSNEPRAGVASGTGSAFNATVDISTTPSVAAGTGTAGDPTGSRLGFIASTFAITTATINVPTNNDGDFLLLMINRSYASTGSIDLAAIQALGWANYLNQGDAGRSAVFWKIADSEPASYDLSGTIPGGNYVNIMHSYSGVDPLDPIQSYRYRENASSGVQPTGALVVRPGQTGMAVSVASAARGTAMTPPTGWTGAGGGSIGGTGTSNTAAEAAWRRVTAGDYVSGSWAFGNAAVAYLYHFALKDADQPLATAVRDFSGGNTTAPIIPWSTRPGDLLVAFVSSRAAGTVGAPAGWHTMFGNISQSGYSQNAFWRIASSEVPGSQPYTFTGPAATVTELLVITAASFGTAAAVTTATGSTVLPALTFGAQSPDAMIWAFGCIRGDVSITAGASGYAAHLGVSNGGASGNIGQYSFFEWSPGPNAAATSMTAGATPTNAHHIALFFGVNAGPTAAPGTGSAFDATVDIAPTAEVAVGLGEAFDAPIGGEGTSATAIVASGSGASFDASASLAPNSDAAGGTGAAGGPSSSVAASIGLASGTGSAFNATISTASAVSANAEVAGGSGTAYGASASLAPHGGVAGGSGSVGGPSSSVAISGGHAAGSGSAFDPTASTATLVYASAEVASGTAAALGASASVAPNAGVGSGTGIGRDANPVGGQRALPTRALGTGTAYNATVVTAHETEADAGVATGTGTAFDAVIIKSAPNSPTMLGRHPEYRGRAMAIHVHTGATASVAAIGPSRDEPVYPGQVMPIMPYVGSPTLHDEALTGPLFDRPHYKGRSQAIHVRSDTPPVTPPPPTPIPSCRCCGQNCGCEGGGDCVDVISPIDLWEREDTTSPDWGEADNGNEWSEVVSAGCEVDIVSGRGRLATPAISSILSKTAAATLPVQPTNIRFDFEATAWTVTDDSNETLRFGVQVGTNFFWQITTFNSTSRLTLTPSSPSASLSFFLTPNTTYHVLWEITPGVGSKTKIWEDGEDEPEDWTLEALTSSVFGIGGFVFSLFSSINTTAPGHSIPAAEVFVDNFGEVECLGSGGCDEPPIVPGGTFSTLVFSDNFEDRTIAEGHFLDGGDSYVPGAAFYGTADGRYGVFKDGWSDTSHHGRYDPSIISVHDGILDLHLHTRDGYPRVATLTCRPTGSSAKGGILGGRSRIVARGDLMENYKGVPLWWADLATTNDMLMLYGEIDWPEGDFPDEPHGFVHRTNSSVLNDQYVAIPAGDISWQDWHEYVTEWVPGVSVTFYVDGVVVGATTDRIPTVPMHFNLQFETSLGGAPTPDPDVEGHVEIAEVQIWAYTGPGGAVIVPETCGDCEGTEIGCVTRADTVDDFLRINTTPVVNHVELLSNLFGGVARGHYLRRENRDPLLIEQLSTGPSATDGASWETNGSSVNPHPPPTNLNAVGFHNDPAGPYHYDWELRRFVYRNGHGTRFPMNMLRVGYIQAYNDSNAGSGFRRSGHLAAAGKHTFVQIKADPDGLTTAMPDWDWGEVVYEYEIFGDTSTGGSNPTATTIVGDIAWVPPGGSPDFVARVVGDADGAEPEEGAGQNWIHVQDTVSDFSQTGPAYTVLNRYPNERYSLNLHWVDIIGNHHDGWGANNAFDGFSFISSTGSTGQLNYSGEWMEAPGWGQGTGDRPILWYDYDYTGDDWTDLAFVNGGLGILRVHNSPLATPYGGNFDEQFVAVYGSAGLDEDTNPMPLMAPFDFSFSFRLGFVNPIFANAYDGTEIGLFSGIWFYPDAATPILDAYGETTGIDMSVFDLGSPINVHTKMDEDGGHLNVWQDGAEPAGWMFEEPSWDYTDGVGYIYPEFYMWPPNTTIEQELAIGVVCEPSVSSGCAECEDPNNPGFQLPPFTPGYLPIFRRQIGDPTTNLDAFICTMEAGAMALDWHTRGAVQVWGGELIPYSGRTEASIYDSGTNLNDVQQAWLHWGQSLSVRSGQTWSQLVAALNEGRAVILQGDYDQFASGDKCQSNFEGNHAILLLPYEVSGRILVGDPLCSDFHGVSASTLQAYAEDFGHQVFGPTSPQKILFAVTQGWAP